METDHTGGYYGPYGTKTSHVVQRRLTRQSLDSSLCAITLQIYIQQEGSVADVEGKCRRSADHQRLSRMQ